MSPEQKHATIGRMTQDYREAKAEAGLIEDEVERAGLNFIEMGKMLINNPEGFVGADGVIDPNPTFQRIHEWTARLRELRPIMTKLQERLRDAGVDVS